MKDLTISVITVCYNSSETIRETLESVLSQTYPSLEYIIIDGASKDDTLNIIAEYRDKVRLVVSEPDSGIYDAMNKGIKLATGDIIGFLNADDLYHDETVIETIAKIFSENNIDVSYGDLVYFSKNNSDKIKRYWQSSAFKQGLFAKGWSPPHPTFFVRKQIYSNLGFFNTSYSMGNDVELMMRFLEKGQLKSIYIPKVLVKMRLGGVSNRNFKNVLEQNRNILRAFGDHHIHVSPLKFYFYKFFNRILQFLFHSREGQNDAK